MNEYIRVMIIISCEMSSVRLKVGSLFKFYLITQLPFYLMMILTLYTTLCVFGAFINYVTLGEREGVHPS